VSSTLFAFHNERNRLLTLIRCASVGAAAQALARFVLTTASLAVRGLRTGQVQQPRNLRVGLRLQGRALGGTPAPVGIGGPRPDHPGSIHRRGSAARQMTDCSTVGPRGRVVRAIRRRAARC
jgi:hypothetical protein